MVFVRQERVVLEVGRRRTPRWPSRLGRRLRAELRELDVDAVAFEPGEAAPAGAKGPDAVTVGALVVATAATT
jgi:hypothetical protein